MPPLQPRLSDPVCRRARSESVDPCPLPLQRKGALLNGVRGSAACLFNAQNPGDHVCALLHHNCGVWRRRFHHRLEILRHTQTAVAQHTVAVRVQKRKLSGPLVLAAPALAASGTAVPGYLAAALRRSARGTCARILTPAAHAWLVDGRSATCLCARSAEAGHGWKATACEAATAAVHAASINFRDMRRTPAALLPPRANRPHDPSSLVPPWRPSPGT